MAAEILSKAPRDAVRIDAAAAAWMPQRFIKSMLADLAVQRPAILELFLLDLRAQRQASLLGRLWLWLAPVAAMLPWWILSEMRVVRPPASPVPYAAFVLVGAALWQLFVDALNAPLTHMERSKHLLSRVAMPGEVLLLGGIADVVVKGAIRVFLLGGVLLSVGLRPGPATVLAPVGLIAIVLFAFSLGSLLTPAALLFRDVQRSLGVVTGFWFFITPVVYEGPTTGLLSRLVWLNPAATLIVGTRELLIDGRLTNPAAFLLTVGASFTLVPFAWILTRLALPHVVGRLGGR